VGSNNPRIPYVRDGKLYRHDGTLVCAVASSLADKTGWYDWLEDPRHKSFAFVASNGAHCTAIKERRRSTSGAIHFYWYAYRSINNVKRRVSLGKSRKIDLARLSEAATRLAQLELIPESDSPARRRERARSPKPKALSFGTLL
jgi:hypothetical protein